MNHGQEESKEEGRKEKEEIDEQEINPGHTWIDFFIMLATRKPGCSFHGCRASETSYRRVDSLFQSTTTMFLR
jgi:hypothetical protein